MVILPQSYLGRSLLAWDRYLYFYFQLDNVLIILYCVAAGLAAVASTVTVPPPECPNFSPEGLTDLLADTVLTNPIKLYVPSESGRSLRIVLVFPCIAFRLCSLLFRSCIRSWYAASE